MSKKLISQIKDHPRLYEWLHNLDKDRTVSQDQLQASTYYGTFARLPLQGNGNDKGSLLPSTINQTGSSLNEIRSESHTLFVPNYREHSCIMGTLFGENSPNVQALTMLQAAGFGQVSHSRGRKFVLDLHSESLMSFLEFEWFTDGKLVVSMHDYNDAGDYCGESVVFQCHGDIESGNLMKERTVIMNITYDEVMECEICKGRNIGCQCSPAFRRRARGFPKMISSWGDWCEAMHRIRSGLSVIKTSFTVKVSNTKSVQGEASFSLRNYCDRGLRAGGTIMSPVSEMRRLYVRENGYLEHNPLCDNQIANSYVENVYEDMAEAESQGHELNVHTFDEVTPGTDSDSLPDGIYINGNSYMGNGGEGIVATEPQAHGLTVSGPGQTIPNTGSLSQPDLTHVNGETIVGHAVISSKSSNPSYRPGPAVQNDKTKIECLCGRTFKHTGHYHEHFQGVHLNIRSHFCDVPQCGAAFKKKCDLYRHRLALHGLSRKFKCLLCDASFDNRDLIPLHVRESHADVRPFPCPHCPSSYSNMSGLKKHIRNKHETK